MDISSLSIPLSTGRMAGEIGVALLSKVLDVAETTGDALAQMMEAPIIPGLGEHIDVRA